MFTPTGFFPAEIRASLINAIIEAAVGVAPDVPLSVEMEPLLMFSHMFLSLSRIRISKAHSMYRVGVKGTTIQQRKKVEKANSRVKNLGRLSRADKDQISPNTPFSNGEVVAKKNYPLHIELSFPIIAQHPQIRFHS